MNENLISELHEDNGNKLQMEITNQPQDPISENQSLTKEDIIKRLENLSQENEIPARNEVENLKYGFYKLKASEIEASKDLFVTDGGNPEDFVIPTDTLEEKLKSLLSIIKEKRAKAIAEEEAIKEQNLQQKLSIIEKIKNLSESTDDFNKLYKEFKDLQLQWNEIKQVPASKVNELWKSYQTYNEKFYDLIKINHEFRDYDFKKNLELKTSIIDAVEKLNNESDIISAFHQLQNFHQQWREIGPVIKEKRDEVWEKFKALSSEINKKHQKHFEDLKMQEENNLAEKRAICATLKTIDYSTLHSFKDWDDKSKEIIELQAKWKSIGFVPKKYNNQIFEEYRALCDTFFDNKAKFFKGQKDEMDQNLQKKKTLCEKAEALKDSTDWKKTTNDLIALQKEWKTIGAVPRKYSDIIWKQFVTACDYFFEQKNKNTSDLKTEESENLIKKREIISQIELLEDSGDPNKDLASLRQLMDQWHAIGFVPFKEKDKVYKEFQNALDKQFERLKVDKSERRMQSFMANIDDIAKSDQPKKLLYRERERLTHQFNKIKSELLNYENNIGFLSISKNAGSLLKDMEHKMQGLKDEMKLISQKIDTINKSLEAIN